MIQRRNSLAIACLSLATCAALGTGPAVAANGRAYELVTPADTAGNDLEAARFAQTARPVPASSADGSAFAFVNITGGLIDGAENGAVNLYRSARTATGWQTRYTGPPAAAGGQYRVSGASDDLRRLIFLQDYGTRLDPADPDPDGDVALPDARLFSSVDGTAFTRLDRGSAMAPFDEPGRTERNSSVLLATDPSATDAVFRTERQMEPEPVGGLGLNAGRVYRRVGETTQLVSVDETGRPLSDAFVRAWPASDDLRRVYVEGEKQGTGARSLYLWNDGESVEASASKRTTADPSVFPVSLQDVSADGRSAIFRTKRALTNDDAPDSGDGNSGQDLYLYRLPSSGEAQDATLTRITGSTPGTSARLVAASRDHARIYFSSDAALTPDAVPGGFNLYLDDDGQRQLVATLADADREVSNPGAPEEPYVASSLGEGPIETNRQTRIDGDGSVLVFRSQAALAGAPGGTSNIFRYDAVSKALSCVSCGEDPSATGETQFGIDGLVRGRNLTADGSEVYFETTAALVPADTNGTWDVYAFDAAKGTPELVSNGTAARGARYIENSSDGRDVFFSTRDPLVPQDRNGVDEALRIYDARVGGGFAADVPQPPCVGDACRALIADRPVPTPVGSTAVTGAGDPPVAKAPPAAPRTPVLARISASQVRSFARTGRVRLAVSELGGRVAIRGTVEELRGSRRVRLAVGTRTIKSATAAVLTVRASKAGRARLRSGRRLRLRITVSRTGTSRVASRTITVPATRRAR